MRRFGKYRFAPVLTALFLILLSAACACAQPWSFTIFSDSRSEYSAYRSVFEQIKSNGPSDPKFPPPDFVAAVGDIDPLETTVRIYNETIGPGVPFVPVRGNHESRSDVQFMLKQVLPALKFPLKYYDPLSTTYYFDHKNIRFISIDTYTAYGKGLRDPGLLDWVEKAITSATSADHVFIAFHEPHLPLEPMRDPFWAILLRHTDKVRAVFCGHTHVHTRRFVPDTYGGVHFINSGSAGQKGHSDKNLTIVGISVDRKDVQFRTIQAPQGMKVFRVTDRWSAASRGE
ncbi:MAG: metallophosphoesterase [Syntrophobacteraceae bacterium]